MKHPFQKALLPALIGSIFTLSACGGGSSEPTANKTLTTGVITGFGSVYVNGCKYETDSASIDADDNSSASQDDLAIGMVVTVSGSTSTDANGQCVGTADRIIYDNEVEGPVAAGSLQTTTDPVTGLPSEVTVMILGQTVRMNADTRFESESDTAYGLGDVAEGDILEVSGLMDDSGAIVATMVELQDHKMQQAQHEYELKGKVAALDTTTMTFEINGMPVDYANARFDDMTADDLMDGYSVEVKGELNATGDTLIATKIEAEDNGMEKGGHYDSELEGVISNYDPDNRTFTLQGVTVDASQVEKIKPAGLVLGDGIHVEVEGELIVDENGVARLIAKEIKRKGEKIKIQATVTAIDTSRELDPSADLVTLGVFGKAITVRVNEQTELKYGMLPSVGDFVEVEAFDDGSGVINAYELKPEDMDDAELKGPVDSYDLDNMTITLFGISFDISMAYMSMDHMIPPPADFWSAIDGQGYAKLVDEYPADGVIDKVEVESEDHD